MEFSLDRVSSFEQDALVLSAAPDDTVLSGGLDRCSQADVLRFSSCEYLLDSIIGFDGSADLRCSELPQLSEFLD